MSNTASSSVVQSQDMIRLVEVHHYKMLLHADGVTVKSLKEMRESIR